LREHADDSSTGGELLNGRGVFRRQAVFPRDS
jgi:hypothetical protein